MLLATAVSCEAQPLVDLFSANTLVSEQVDRTELSATLPLSLDTAGRLLVLDPYWVQWHTTTDRERYAPALDTDLRETMRGVGGAITYVTPLNKRWKLAVAGIGRYHWLQEQRFGDVQYGGVALASRSFRPTFTLRTGVYANYDAFGWFVMPLLGVDWRINGKTNLYGVLPGSMNLERKSLRWLHWGLSFRAYTTSFGVRDGDYRRINENPRGVYGDLYLTHSLVFRLEGGWCIRRQVLGGPDDPLYTRHRWNSYADHAIPDGAYVRLMLAYRLRLDGPR